MACWYEEIKIGEKLDLGSHTFSEEEIIEFNKEYDNQYFHTDPEKAKYSHFGGLIASGWHTACIGQRKMVDALYAEEARLLEQGKEPGEFGPSPGINELKFITPVRPGDRINYVLSIDDKRPSASLPGWGILFNSMQATNQNGEIVYIAKFVGFSKLRDFKPTLKQRIMMFLAKFPALRKLIKKKS